MKTQDAGPVTLERHDTQRLQKQVTELSDALAHLNNADDFKKLILILRGPGWTTPAEHIFATGIVTSMLAQANVLTQMKNELMRGSALVGQH